MKRLAILALGAAWLSACGGAGGEYPPQYGFNFRSACERAGGPVDFCACVWSKIEAQVPVDQFVAYDAAAQAGRSHPVAQQIVAFSNECRADAAGVSETLN